MINEKTNKQLIFVVDDEPDILELIEVNLKKSGYTVQTFPQAGPMLETLKKKQPNLIVLDLMLPDYDGLEVCKLLKKDIHYHSIPIIMVTAKGEELDIVLGLEFGADDYIPKPFSPRELIARVKAVLRRTENIGEVESTRQVIGNLLEIDPEKFEVLVDKKKVMLTFTEFSILQILSGRIGWVYSREKILDKLWGDEKDVFDRTIDVHIKNLRDKLGKAGKMIKNVRGVGYKLEL